MTVPEYPTSIRFENIEGNVRVAVQIGSDGRVTHAQGTGENQILVRAAEKSAGQMVFRPRLPFLKPPHSYQITFVYKLRGRPSVVDFPPMIEADNLPDSIEIFGKPLVSDYPPVTEIGKNTKAVPKKR
jgi:hypothetical protein